jgi:hypothetical protein
VLAFRRACLSFEDFRGFDATSAVSESSELVVVEGAPPEPDPATPGATSVVEDDEPVA